MIKHVDLSMLQIIVNTYRIVKPLMSRRVYNEVGNISTVLQRSMVVKFNVRRQTKINVK